MPKPFKGTIDVDIRDSVPDWEPYEQPRAPEGAPNVLYIVWDDVGFGTFDVYGGLVETPNQRAWSFTPRGFLALDGRNATAA